MALCRKLHSQMEKSSAAGPFPEFGAAHPRSSTLGRLFTFPPKRLPVRSLRRPPGLAPTESRSLATNVLHIDYLVHHEDPHA